MLKLDFFKEKQEMSWEDYLRVLRNYADATWFTVSWDDHIKKFNKFEKMELKPLLPRNKIKIDIEIENRSFAVYTFSNEIPIFQRLSSQSLNEISKKYDECQKIISTLFNQMVFTDGDITRKEKIRLEELKINQLEKDSVVIKEKKLTKTIVSFQQQVCLFYELIQIAIIDGELHANEFKYLATAISRDS